MIKTSLVLVLLMASLASCVYDSQRERVRMSSSYAEHCYIISDIEKSKGSTSMPQEAEDLIAHAWLTTDHQKFGVIPPPPLVSIILPSGRKKSVFISGIDIANTSRSTPPEHLVSSRAALKSGVYWVWCRFKHGGGILYKVVPSRGGWKIALKEIRLSD